MLKAHPPDGLWPAFNLTRSTSDRKPHECASTIPLYGNQLSQAGTRITVRRSNVITPTSATAKAEGGKGENIRSSWHFLSPPRLIPGMGKAGLQTAQYATETELTTDTSNPPMTGSLCGQLLGRDHRHDQLTGARSSSQRECYSCWDRAR